MQAMEAVESGARQNISLPSSISGFDQRQASQHSYLPQPTSVGHRDTLSTSSMATTTLVHSAAGSQHHNTSYPSSFSQTSSNNSPSLSNMISSESRRDSDDHDTAKRQSLPSISEVINKAYPQPPAYPHQHQPQQPQQPPVHQHPLHAASQAPRYEPDWNLQHPLPPFAHRQDGGPPGFSDSPRTPYSARSSLPPVGERRPSPPGPGEIPAHHDARMMNGSYAPAPPAPHHTSYPSAQLPQGQMPLPGYPISPRHAPPHGYDSARSYMTPEEIRQSNSFGDLPYGDILARLGHASRTLFNFAEAYSRIAQEQHGQHTIPERLPTEQEVNDMMANAELTRGTIARLKEIVLHSLRTERAREHNKPKGPYEDDHGNSYGDNPRTQYGLTEVKKRRGRAAPPGRCHSCNRIDTPEWRRGPDGARTLCNACGLHYAKLERKRQLEARSIRPKVDDTN
ncbi:hypothetical protein N3K66_004308 [Trichothecium roseum]|uniref:Uncharacterized protein n=1 Tax=Trichothecium roseum TaxID=47278 RepID=A0ACC0V2Q0_9HYPO|nr:hypothetical protein N3K66_004308 [Trichothecium roseum]